MHFNHGKLRKEQSTVTPYPIAKENKFKFHNIYISGVVLWYCPFVIYKAVGLPTWLDQTPNVHTISTKGIGQATEVNSIQDSILSYM